MAVTARCSPVCEAKTPPNGDKLPNSFSTHLVSVCQVWLDTKLYPPTDAKQGKFITSDT